MFYPVPTGGTRSRRGFDDLRFYAEHFDTVEVNSSFYRVPSPATARKWVERTPPGFEFSLKLYQKFTHPEMFEKATGGDPFDLGQKDVDEFRAAIEPIASAGKLGALLAQFPASFKHEPNNRGYLEWLLERFRDYLLAVELRHATWSDDAAGTLDLLDAYGAAWALIDEPKFRDSVRQDLRFPLRGGPRAANRFYYLRLHGRNAKQWWSHEKSEDRYNYLYSRNELKPLAAAARDVARAVKKAYLYANNHFSAKSVANAAILKHELGQPVTGEYPQEIVDRYPDLRGIVKVLPSPLLPSPS